MRGFNESQSHTDQAQEYKKEQSGLIVAELDTRLSEYAKSLSKDQKEHIKSNITSHMNAKVAEMEQAYLAMRSKRGEKITIQDMDDIMPYLRLTMLRDLHTYIADRSSEGAVALAEEITTLEGEIATARKRIGTLRGELGTEKERTEAAFNELWGSSEFGDLLEAQKALGENSGSTSAWKEVQSMLSHYTDIGKLQESIRNTKEKVQIDKKYAALLATQDFANSIGSTTITAQNAQEYIDKIDGVKTQFNGINFWKAYTEYYTEGLDAIKTELQKVKDGQQNNLNQTINDLRTGDLESDIADYAAQKSVYDFALGSGRTIEEIQTKARAQISDLEGKKAGLESDVESKKEKFKEKVNAIKPLIEAQTEKARKLGRIQGKVAEMTRSKDGKVKKAHEHTDDVGNSEMQVGTMDRAKEGLNSSQKIRINARNLIVRSGPEKKAKPILDPADKNKAIMLQPGDSVTPILIDGNVETKEDGPREYTHVRLDDGTEGWIALSDKIGSNWKQEYGDISMGESSAGKEYDLKGDNIRLRSGAKKTADILDVLDAKKVKSIQSIKYTNNNAGDVVEGDGKLWRLVEVTYKDDKKQKGYIAVNFLQEKTSSAQDAADVIKDL